MIAYGAGIQLKAKGTKPNFDRTKVGHKPSRLAINTDAMRKPFATHFPLSD
jgi:hypothetical protein